MGRAKQGAHASNFDSVFGSRRGRNYKSDIDITELRRCWHSGQAHKIWPVLAQTATLDIQGKQFLYEMASQLSTKRIHDDEHMRWFMGDLYLRPFDYLRIVNDEQHGLHILADGQTIEDWGQESNHKMACGMFVKTEFLEPLRRGEWHRWTRCPGCDQAVQDGLDDPELHEVEDHYPHFETRGAQQHFTLRHKKALYMALENGVVGNDSASEEHVNSVIEEAEVSAMSKSIASLLNGEESDKYYNRIMDKSSMKTLQTAWAVKHMRDKQPFILEGLVTEQDVTSLYEQFLISLPGRADGYPINPPLDYRLGSLLGQRI